MVEFRSISDSRTDGGTVLNLPEKTPYPSSGSSDNRIESPNFLNYSLSDLVKNSRYRYFSEHNPAFEKNLDIAFGKMRYKNINAFGLMLIRKPDNRRLSVKHGIKEAKKAECFGGIGIKIAFRITYNFSCSITKKTV